MIEGLILYENYPHKNEYLENSLKRVCVSGAGIFPPELIISGMILWDSDTACNWGGPWDEKYVACQITNHTFCYELPSVEQVILTQKVYETYSVYNISHKTFFNLFGWRDDILKDNNGGYRIGFEKISSSGVRCSRSTLTHRELQTFIKHAPCEEVNSWRHRIENLNCDWYKSTPTKEFPIKIYLYGNDDISYSKCCETSKRAIQIVKSLIKKPDWKIISEEFVFTN